MPIVWKSPRLAKLLNIPYFPVTANMLMFGPLGPRGLLPGEVQAPGAAAGALRRRARPGALLAQPGHGRGRPDPRADPGRALRHAADPPQRLVRASGHAGPRHRARARSGAAGSPSSSEQSRRRRDRRRSRHQRAVAAARAHRVRARRLVVLDPPAHRARHAGRHDPAHAPDRRLDEAQRAGDPRDQRDRHDEPAGGGGHRRQPGAQDRREELDARLRRRTITDPYFFREETPRTAARPHPHRAVAPRGRGRSCATSPRTTRTCS